MSIHIALKIGAGSKKSNMTSSLQIVAPWWEGIFDKATLEARWHLTNKEISGYSSGQVRVEGKNRYQVAATNRHAIVSDVVEKNIDSSSKSNPLCRRGKKIMTRWCEGVDVVVEKKIRKSMNFQQKFVIFTYSSNAHRNSGCPLYIRKGLNVAWTQEL